MTHLERTAAEWFEEACRCYLEGHQACAWCRRSHQVYRDETPRGVEFHCYHCDFHVSHDADLDRYALVPGEAAARGGSRATMHDLQMGG
jgi:hypothetical protein